jgi:cell wall-associated NlpC family hydrolase
MSPLRHLPALVLSALLAAGAATAIAAAPAAAPAAETAGTPPAEPAAAPADRAPDGPASAAASVRDGMIDVATIRLPETLLRTAYGFLGRPYVSAGSGESGGGFDCSGLVYRVFHDAAGRDLPRGVAGQFAAGRPIDSPLHVGDLLFFDTVQGGPNGTPDHVGIYAGGGLFVHAASEGARRGVTVSSLGQEYYRARYLGARRLLAWNAPALGIDVTDVTPAMPGREEVDVILPPGVPLRLLVACEREGGRFVTLTAHRDGREAFRRRLKAFPGAAGVAVLQPGAGDWLVNVALAGGQVLAAVRFTVGD